MTLERVATSHSLIVSSSDPDPDLDATSVLSGENVTVLIMSVSSLSFCRSAPVTASHSLIVFSFNPKSHASRVLTGEKVIVLTSRYALVCLPLGFCSCIPQLDCLIARS